MVPTILELPMGSKILLSKPGPPPDAVLCVGCHENNEHSRFLNIPAHVVDRLLQLSIESNTQCLPSIYLTKVKVSVVEVFAVAALFLLKQQRASKVRLTANTRRKAIYRERLFNESLVNLGIQYARRAIYMANLKATKDISRLQGDGGAAAFSLLSFAPTVHPTAAAPTEEMGVDESEEHGDKQKNNKNTNTAAGSSSHDDKHDVK